MKRQPAKVLTPDDVRLLLSHAEGRRHWHRKRVIILLSFKAGLRAFEIAGLEWSMVLDSSGSVDELMFLGRGITKGGRPRRLPIHNQLKGGLQALHQCSGRSHDGPVAKSQRGGAMTAASIVNWFADIYAKCELDGCSSHSGRGTFVTQAARLVAKTEGSLRYVPELAGHRATTTTKR